jgi:hypothetical protein
MRWADHLERIREMRNAYRDLSGIFKSKKHLVDPGEDGDNIKMNLIETGWEGVNLPYLGQCRYGNEL